MPCADNEVNGVPMCANQALLNEQIRSNWSRPDTLIVTDCGAVSKQPPDPLAIPSTRALPVLSRPEILRGAQVTNMVSANKYSKTMVEATAASINSGVDLETGPAWTGDSKPKGGLAEAGTHSGLACCPALSPAPAVG